MYAWFSRDSSELQVIARNCDWFMALFVRVVIGRSLTALILVFRQSLRAVYCIHSQLTQDIAFHYLLFFPFWLFIRLWQGLQEEQMYKLVFFSFEFLSYIIQYLLYLLQCISCGSTSFPKNRSNTIATVRLLKRRLHSMGTSCILKKGTFHQIDSHLEWTLDPRNWLCYFIICGITTQSKLKFHSNNGNITWLFSAS